VLSTAFASVEDLQKVGITALHARALFKLIRVWNAVGVPPEDVLSRPTALVAPLLVLAPPQATIGTIFDPVREAHIYAIKISSCNNLTRTMLYGPILLFRLVLYRNRWFLHAMPPPQLLPPLSQPPILPAVTLPTAKGSPVL
jgi:hypothetical protein